jgi:predicted GH43/DUF377 family glycosyl hydrolase
VTTRLATIGATSQGEASTRNVVFPTAIEEIEGERYVFYGMADTSIGVARLSGS